MALSDLVNQFSFPVDAVKDFEERGLLQNMVERRTASSSFQDVSGRATDIQFSGHDRGLGFKFFTHADENKMKSELCGMEINDEIEMIQWFKNKKEQPVERVHMIPDQVLKFKKKQIETKVGDKIERQMVTVFPLECIGGSLKEDYLRWKQGLQSLGLELSRWNKLTVGQVKTLQSEGIYTVEQFAAMPEDRIVGRHGIPKDLVEAYRAAINFLKAQAPIEGLKDTADKMLEMERDNAKLRDSISALTEMVQSLKEAKTGRVVSKAKRGRPAKGKKLDSFTLNAEG